MPRLFFAIPLPDEVELDLHDLDVGLPDARFTFGVGVHLTLAFLGDVTRQQRRLAARLASEITWPHFELALDGAGVFPLRGKPKVLWLGVVPQPDLKALRKELTSKLRAADFEIERRKFHPHVTLARVGQSPDVRVHEWLDQFVAYRTQPFEVREFHLYQSVLTPKGPHYTLLDVFECVD